MKKLFSTDTKVMPTDLGLLVARIALGLLMLSHGIPKMEQLISGNPIQFPSVFGMGAEVSLALTVFAEVLCSVFILAGLGTRLAVLPLIVTMLVAVFYVHATDVLAKKELAVLYLSGYIVLFFAGSGRFSADHYISRKMRSPENRLPKKAEDPTLAIWL